MDGSDTPRTDAVLIKGQVVTHGDPSCVGGFYAEMPDTVPAELSRQLERENSELRAQLAKAQMDWYRRGREDVKRTNASGCCCMISESDELEEPCAMHKDWLETKLSATEAKLKESEAALAVVAKGLRELSVKTTGWVPEYYTDVSDIMAHYANILHDSLPSTAKQDAEILKAANGRLCITPTHEAADAFWKYWRENGETHKHGYYESTWGAINAALAVRAKEEG